jgi:hypothetical protein
MNGVMLTRSLLLVVLAMASLACTKEAPPANPVPPGGPITAPPEHEHGDAHPPGEKAAGTAATAPIPATGAPRLEGPVGDTLDAYEHARAKLAQDNLAGAQPFATSLAAAARTAADHAVAAKPHYTAIAVAADKIVATKDIKEARAAFGDISKSVIQLLVDDPELRKGRFLFLCPMAKGYQKWVQTDGKLNNPYFGSEMLECGEELKAWSV